MLVAGATLRVMETLSGATYTQDDLPLTEAGIRALRPAVLRDLADLPFQSGAKISRSLWVLFIGEWGVWTHAVFPVDDSLGMPDDGEDITGLCGLVGSFIRPSACHEGEKAMVVLRRPGPTEISRADAYVFHLVHEAAAGYETADWAFYVAGPGGVLEVTESSVADTGKVSVPGGP